MTTIGKAKRNQGSIELIVVLLILATMVIVLWNKDDHIDELLNQAKEDAILIEVYSFGMDMHRDRAEFYEEIISNEVREETSHERPAI